jgi:hypothetical protein
MHQVPFNFYNEDSGRTTSLHGGEMRCLEEHTRHNSWWEHDAQGIPLARVCAECQEKVLATYRPEILTSYTQADVDEPIEPEEY